MKRTRLNPVSAKRRVDSPSKAVIEDVKRRSGGRCELCKTARATQFHHRKPRSAGGGHTVENLVHLCGFGNTSGCHGACHTHPERYAKGWLLRSHDDPALVDFVT